MNKSSLGPSLHPDIPGFHPPLERLNPEKIAANPGQALL
jgi:hypothetical protein